MARKEEIGVKYFPLNSDIIHNKKIKLVVAEFGPKAWAVLLPLYCKIYRENGYWIDWYDQDAKLLFARDECQLDVPFVDEVVAGCLRRGLFDQTVFEMFGVLTSDRIQENFFEAKKRSKGVQFIKEFKAEKLSVDINSENVSIIPINVNIISKNVDTGTQSKKRIKREVEGDNAANGNGDSVESPPPAKYDKGKKNDLKYIHEFIRDNKPTDHQPYVDMWNLFAPKHKLPSVKRLNRDQIKKLLMRIRDPDFDLAKILHKANDSDFCKSGNWFNFHWLTKNETNFLKVLEGNYDNKKATNGATKPIQGPTAAEQKGEELLAQVYGTSNDIREGTTASQGT
ncbi:MAG: DUF4373 domain-containing protein [Agriterribacter sp.]